MKSINIHTEQLQENYTNKIQNHLKNITELCKQYQIEYKLVNTNVNIQKILIEYLTEKQKFK